MKIFGLFVMSLVSLVLIGCPEGSQSKAALASLQVTQVIQTSQDAEIAAFDQHLISPSDHKFIQEQFKTIATLDKSANDCIKSASSQGAVVVCVNTAISGIDQVYTNGGTFLKSSQARSTYQLAISSIRGVLAAINTMLGGTAPPQPAFGGAQ